MPNIKSQIIICSIKKKQKNSHLLKSLNFSGLKLI